LQLFLLGHQQLERLLRIARSLPWHLKPSHALEPWFRPAQPSKKIPSSRLRHSFLRVSQCCYKDINGHHLLFFPHSFPLRTIWTLNRSFERVRANKLFSPPQPLPAYVSITKPEG
jgi:hypothetical protein